MFAQIIATNKYVFIDKFKIFVLIVEVQKNFWFKKLLQVYALNHFSKQSQSIFSISLKEINLTEPDKILNI